MRLNLRDEPPTCEEWQMDNGRCTLGSSFAGVVTVVGARQPEAFNEEGVVGEYFWVDKALTSVSV